MLVEPPFARHERRERGWIETIETDEPSRILSSAVVAGAGSASLEEPMYCIMVGTQNEWAARRWPGGRVDTVVGTKLTLRITPYGPNCSGS